MSFDGSGEVIDNDHTATSAKSNPKTRESRKEGP